eukprot:CAMPEP_0178536202 /NCGR_PEP_ID=MMETSP0696-20121128/35952_1 /TAXON_ID=265572 /ORGANISM="Extubocellulus spinifer, Strain CCMP396" /LENGTH=55 /DNA_ID=CAMNT_0020168391 /DNA_START=226 /DNA_END=393 /DNA_ORIENTATION=-
MSAVVASASSRTIAAMRGGTLSRSNSMEAVDASVEEGGVFLPVAVAVAVVARRCS